MPQQASGLHENWKQFEAIYYTKHAPCIQHFELDPEKVGVYFTMASTFHSPFFHTNKEIFTITFLSSFQCTLNLKHTRQILCRQNHKTGMLVCRKWKTCRGFLVALISIRQVGGEAACVIMYRQHLCMESSCSSLKVAALI